MPDLNPYDPPQVANVQVAELVSNRAERKAILLNGILWSLGNLLTTGPFILFLANDLGAKGFAREFIAGAAEPGWNDARRHAVDILVDG